jgi:polar amino acid transport system substrate-binding protein
VSLRRRLAASAGLCATALIVAACGNGGKEVTVQGAKLVKKGHLTTCTHLPYPPFQSAQGGKVVGFDVDVIDLVAKTRPSRRSRPGRRSTQASATSPPPV